ncbi:Uncharacterised protein [Mycobacteroides abscessus subsp. abscessus]|nr:Uncharacterised protein [Mycobacteroides abscessus subsp. abscessus]
MAVPSVSVAAGSLPSIPAAASISRASVTVSATTSSGPPPASTSSDSCTSTAFPAVAPNGVSIAVSRALVATPCAVPRSTIAEANSRARCSDFMNAPAPTLTSRTSAAVPSASFLLMIDPAMSGIDSTVPVISRSA